MILLTQGKPTTCPLVDPLGSSQIRQTPTITVVMLQIWGFVRVLQNEKRQGHVSVAHSTLSHLGFSPEWLQENPPSPSQSQSITENSREKKNIQTNKTKNQKKKKPTQKTTQKNQQVGVNHPQYCAMKMRTRQIQSIFFVSKSYLTICLQRIRF